MNVQWPPLAIGSGVALAILGALWKAARMRGDANRDWSSRISAVEAGLNQRAIGELSILRRMIDEQIGGSDTTFDPMSASADPAALLKLVKNFERCLFARRRARQFFQALLSLGSFTGSALLVLLVCDILIALHSSQVLPLRRFFWWVIAAAGVAMLTGMGVIGAQWYLQQKLTDAEILGEQREARDA
jgi:hypothetical protein